MITMPALWLGILLAPIQMNVNCDIMAFDPVPRYVEQGDLLVPVSIKVWQCADIDDYAGFEPVVQVKAKAKPRKKRYRRKRRR